MKLTTRLVVATLVGAVVISSCGGSDGGDESSSDSLAPDGVLAEAGCPATVVIQTDWFPEAEHGGSYQLIGPGYTIDKDEGAVTGPLYAGGSDTGVDLEIRAGGPFLGGQSVISTMFQDPDVLLGYVNTDQAIKSSKDFPTVAVVAPLDISPQMIMWDADAHPDAKTIADIATEVDTISVFGAVAYMEYLIAEGIVPADKVDPNYQGDKLLVTEGETVAHQGFATSEPFQYANLETGAIDTAYQLIHDTGWDYYPEALSIRSDRVEENRACLSVLVPILQQAQLDYVADHAAADEVLISANTTYASFWQYGQADADFSVEQQIALHIVGNGATTTFGDLEEDRVAAFIDKAVPIFESQGIDVKDDLTVADIVDNSFVDPTITYGG